MGFIVCTVEPLEGGSVRLQLVRRVSVSGRRGLFALHLPKLVGEGRRGMVAFGRRVSAS